MYGSEFEVVHVDREYVRAAANDSGQSQRWHVAALAELNKEGNLKISYVPRNLDPNEPSTLREMSEKQLKAVSRRLGYVMYMLRVAPENPCSKRVIERHLADTAKELRDRKVPSASSVAAWIKRWLDGGRQDAVLANQSKPSRKDWRDENPVAMQLLDQAISTVYLTPERGTKALVQAEVSRLVANHNAVNKDSVARPSAYIVDKTIRALDRYERDRRRYGAQYANRRHRAAGRAFTASRLLELCMADGQLMDVVVVEEDPHGGPVKPLGRPFLTVIMDVRSRCVLAALVTLQPFCASTLLKALETALVASPGRPRGVMEKLIVDNGADYRSSSFARFAAEVGIVIDWCGPRQPNGKAIVERFFRTLNERLIHRLPGTTFSNPQERGDYRSQDRASITLADLQKRVEHWIDVEYHSTVHSTLKRQPLAVWQEEAA